MAKLTYAQRKRMPKSSFAIPSAIKQGPRGGKSTRGAYPVENAAHARNALARVSRFGTPAEKAVVRAKVHKKYPGIGKGKK